MADVLTRGRAEASATDTVWDTTRVLIGMRKSLARNSPGGSELVISLRGVGLLLAVGTMLLGLIRFDPPERSTDLLATLTLGWTIGWVMGPIAVRGAGQGLRAEWFALVPIHPRRLAAGMLGASFAGFAPAVTLVAFAALPVSAFQLGTLPVLVAVPAMLLQLLLAVLASRIVVAALTATLNSRRGQELGGLLMAVVIALASGGWSLASVMGQQLAEGPGSALPATLRVLPTGWGPASIAAADRSDWPLAFGALAGLAALSGVLLIAWARLLPSNMLKPGGQAAPGVGRRLRRNAAAAQRPDVSRGLLPAGPTGAVIGKELRVWRRDPGRLLLLLIALLVSGLNVAVPAIAFDAPEALPWAGLAAAVIVSMGAANLYGDDGTALWLTRMVPGVEQADVRGRQVAWLLVVAPAMVGLTLALTALTGQGWAWPWVLGTLPAILGGTAGLAVLVSVTMPVRQKDPHRRAGPFDTADDASTAGAVIGQQYLMLVLAVLLAVPGGILVLLGATWGRPVLQAVGVAVGVSIGVLLYWWGGRVAGTRLASRGAELMDLLHLGPETAAAATKASQSQRQPVPLSGWKAAAVGTLWTAGMLCIFPQGLVPVGFNLLGVDQEVKVWFAAGYVQEGLQLPVAVGFILAGGVAIWLAEFVRRRSVSRAPQTAALE